ncbi:hypothetical protein QUF80_04955 [Desulfococcaceae bacterium HSG8]|nr:hypothetical protein [Desulfococcaceae bacterium HSG8]
MFTGHAGRQKNAYSICHNPFSLPERITGIFFNTTLYRAMPERREKVSDISGKIYETTKDCH